MSMSALASVQPEGLPSLLEEIVHIVRYMAEEGVGKPALTLVGLVSR